MTDCNKCKYKELCHSLPEYADLTCDDIKVLAGDGFVEDGEQE